MTASAGADYIATILHPTGFNSSHAQGVSGGQQVGYGSQSTYSTGNRALLWSGTADSYVDLHPTTGFRESYAYDVSDGQQVGYGSGPFITPHALLWSGTAESYVDLHSYLPGGYTRSYARGIDSEGNIVGYARDIHLTSYAVMWTPEAVIPTPGAFFLGSIGLSYAGLLLRRKR